MKWINSIPKPYKYIGLALLLVGLVFAFTQYQESLRQQGRNEEIAKCNAGKQEAINENIKIRKKQDMVIRLDELSLIERLRDGKI